MALDTGIPPWLQRNWAPRETFDPTPWLQERYNRQIEAQKLPLQLQGMALQNKSAQLAIQHQGMVNEVQGMELQEMEKDQPLIDEWTRSTGGNPQKIITNPDPPVTSVHSQNFVLNAKKLAWDTAYGISLKQKIIQQTATAVDLMAKGGPMLKPGPDGLFDEAELSKAGEIVRAKEEARRLSEIKATVSWHETLGGYRQDQLQFQREREQRLADQFAFQQKKFEEVVPADRLAEYRERSNLIRNNINALTNPELATQQLKDLATELGIGSGRQTVTPTGRVRVKSPGGKIGTIPLEQLNEALKSGYMKLD